MTFHVRWGLAFRIAGIALLAIIACLFAFVQIDQHILRWRAERLLADVRQIQMGKSNWADAQRLMNRWGEWGAWQGECSSNYCDYEISLDDASHALRHFPLINGGAWGSELRWSRRVNRPYSWFGGRLAVVKAEFKVLNGFIRSKSFAVLTTQFPETYDEHGELIPISKSSLIAEAVCSTSLLHLHWLSKDTAFSVDNPEISLFVDDGRDGHDAEAQFTPFADQKSINALLDFNLDCLTSWKECRSVRELMPSAVSLYSAAISKSSRSGEENFLRGLPLWIAARDAEYVAIAEVLHAPSLNPPNGGPLRMLSRVKKLLKGDSNISGRSFYTIKTVGSDESCPVSPGDARSFPHKAKVLLAFSGQINEQSTPEAELSPCIVAPMTDQNLAAIQRGVARDTVLYDPAITSP